MSRRLDISFLLRPVSQVILMLITSSILYFVSSLYISQLHFLDPSPTLNQYTEQEKKDGIHVETGMLVNNFLTFDLLSNDFVVDGILWFKFDKTKITMEQVEQSVISKGDLKTQSILLGSAKPVIKEDGNNVFAQYHVNIKFISNLNHRLFPFDGHRLYLTLNNKHMDKNVVFDVGPNEFIIPQKIYTPGWKYAARYVVSGYATKTLISNDEKVSDIHYPRTVYAVDFERDSFKNILLLLLPLLITLFMSFFTFTYDYEEYAKNILAICASTVATMVGYRFVITNNSPKVPYFMLIDHLFNLFFMLAFLIFIVNVFNIFKHKNTRSLALLSVHSLLISGWCGLLYWWGL